MSSLTNSTAIPQATLCVSGEDHACGAAMPAGFCHQYIILRDPEEVLADFIRHVDSLPSLDDFTEELRQKDSAFEENSARAHEERYNELLSEAEAGVLSRVYVERITRGMTQAELAGLIDTRQPNISRIENPDRQLSPRVAKRLGEVFCLDYKELL